MKTRLTPFCHIPPFREIENNWFDKPWPDGTSAIQFSEPASGGTYSNVALRNNSWNGTVSGFDFQLAPGAAAINRGHPTDFPPNDIDGQARPLGGRADAGADERE